MLPSPTCLTAGMDWLAPIVQLDIAMVAGQALISRCRQYDESFNVQPFSGAIVSSSAQGGLSCESTTTGPPRGTVSGGDVLVRIAEFTEVGGRRGPAPPYELTYEPSAVLLAAAAADDVWALKANSSTVYHFDGLRWRSYAAQQSPYRSVEIGSPGSPAKLACWKWRAAPLVARVERTIHARPCARLASVVARQREHPHVL